MSSGQERFLAGLFTTWFALRRGHVTADKRDKRHGQACAESCRYTFNALIKT